MNLLKPLFTAVETSQEYRVIIEYKAGRVHKSFTDRYICTNENKACIQARKDLIQETGRDITITKYETYKTAEI